MNSLLWKKEERKHNRMFFYFFESLCSRNMVFSVNAWSLETETISHFRDKDHLPLAVGVWAGKSFPNILWK